MRYGLLVNKDDHYRNCLVAIAESQRIVNKVELNTK